MSAAPQPRPSRAPVSAGEAGIAFVPDDLVEDPYPTYARLRETAPLWWHDDTGMWLVSRHADVDALLRDRRLGRVFTPYEPLERFAPWNLLNTWSLLEMEPPDHTRLRQLVARPFTPRRIAGLRPRIAALAAGLLERVDPDGFDLIAGFADLLPVAVIAELLGVPEELRGALRPWSNRIVALYELGHDQATADAAVTAAAEFTTALRALIVHRRRVPGDDLLSALVHARVDGDALTDDELVATAALLLNAGHEASVNVIGNGVVAMAGVPDQVARLRAAPQGWRDAVDEIIRYDTPLSLFQRTVLAPVEVAGRRLEPGARVGLLLGSANRDPAAFAAPDVLDLARNPNPHLGFGAGIHYCLGAPLARLEGAIAFEQLHARAAEIAVVGPLERRPSYQFRGWARVPVRLTNCHGSAECVSPA